MLLALATLTLLTAVDADTDGDGLSDFAEQHKYFTDSTKADSDGDGISDGDWSERREYAYSVRAVVNVLPPINTSELNDDYQDVRVLKADAEAVQLEIVIYPFNTNAETTDEDADWREHAKAMSRWLEPGITSNWDESMRTQLRSELKRDGIDVDQLTDRSLVERVAPWLMERNVSEPVMTSCSADFSQSPPRVPAELEAHVARHLKQTGRTLEEQWAHELFGKQMFQNRTRGTCTSSAIFQSTAFKALGLPARTIVTIPVVDATDDTQVRLIEKNIENQRIRKAMLSTAHKNGKVTWASHTYNEVFIAGRWRRLNYEHLGQNVFDPRYGGLNATVNTVRDHSESGMLSWQLRQEHGKRNALFGGKNPYACLSLSESWGEHATRDESPTPRSLTIDRATWYDAQNSPQGHALKNIPEGGHLLLYASAPASKNETKRTDYSIFYDRVAKGFRLRAPKQRDVIATAMRGYWNKDGAFYVNISPQELSKMQAGVAYAVVADAPDGAYQWQVAQDVTVVRP